MVAGAVTLDEQFSFSVGSFCSFYLPTFSSICQWHSGCFFFRRSFFFLHCLFALRFSFVVAFSLSFYCACVSVRTLHSVCVCVCLILHFRFIRLFIILGRTKQKNTKNLHLQCVLVRSSHRGDLESRVSCACTYTISKFSNSSSAVAVVMSMTPLIIIFAINFDRIVDEN